MNLDLTAVYVAPRTCYRGIFPTVSYIPGADCDVRVTAPLPVTQTGQMHEPPAPAALRRCAQTSKHPPVQTHEGVSGDARRLIDSSLSSEVFCESQHFRRRKSVGEEIRRGCLAVFRSSRLPPPSSLRLSLRTPVSPFPRRLESEGLLDGIRSPALWREHDNEVYRREDYTILTLPLV